MDMPALTMGPMAHALGRFWHVIRPAASQNIIAVAEVNVSARRKEPLYALTSGEKIIVTERPQIKERVAEADGVLRLSKDGKASWIWHRAVEAFSAEIQAKGWQQVAKEINRSWEGQFTYRSEVRDQQGNTIQRGLRPPQIGGLHAIGMHWSLYHQQATIVMPTGT